MLGHVCVWMRCRPTLRLGALGAAAFLAGCEVQKSENPLSPTVAGPIPGVTITTPRVVEPLSGARIPVAQQPVTLTIDNATSSGVRPLSYLFEIASDVSFANKVLTRDNVSPGASGRTSFRLPQALAAGRTYYWRARAQDGANSGTFSPASFFEVYVPVVIGTPAPIAPIDGVTVSSPTPLLTFINAPSTGTAGPLTYQVVIADNVGFTPSIGVWPVPEQPTSTAFQVPGGVLLSGKQYFWTVRAVDGVTQGPWAIPQSFFTAPLIGGGTDPAGRGARTVLGGR